MLKKLLPFERLIYHSSLNRQELTAHLENEIEPEKSFSFGFNNPYTKPYLGRVYDSRFEIKKNITYRNSFLPLIKGEIREDLNGTKINVKMQLHTFVKVFMIVWLGGVSLALLGVIFTVMFSNESALEALPGLLIPLGMLLFGTAMVSFGFKAESKKSIQDLEQILQAKIISQ
ncbi:hypothetical protein [Flavobacterium foetidum]|uniref:hypothetical protein n=1 Tax=Flavobacterium foetidum TaxID=2026681 RepID=UPI001074E35D|nr:hypothetical protein [Flavobacterium foetidum]KAF2516589.1 DUF2339 domain-containing protein [Flavobacterium foetidum]